MKYLEIKNQIGCGYCDKEDNCNIKDPKVNKAKNGCEYFAHWTTNKMIKPHWCIKQGACEISERICFKIRSKCEKDNRK
jgi:hypothetical protein